MSLISICVLFSKKKCKTSLAPTCTPILSSPVCSPSENSAPGISSWTDLLGLYLDGPNLDCNTADWKAGREPEQEILTTLPQTPLSNIVSVSFPRLTQKGSRKAREQRKQTWTWLGEQRLSTPPRSLDGQMALQCLWANEISIGSRRARLLFPPFSSMESF